MQLPPSTRRDLRFALNQDSGEISFVTDDGTDAFSARLSAISVAGLSFQLPQDSAVSFAPGSTLSPVTVRVGHCSVDGLITIRNIRSSSEMHELGCLFVPSNDADEERWMILLEGFEAASIQTRPLIED